MTDIPIETPTSLESRPYVSFSPRPSSQYWSGYRLTSIQPTVLAANRSAFGEIFYSFFNIWAGRTRYLALVNQHLTVWLGSIIGIVGDYDREVVVERIEDHGLDRVRTYNGFGIFNGSPYGVTRETVALGDEALFVGVEELTEEAAARLEHLIDLQTGEETPYFEAVSAFDHVIPELPQGAFTRLYTGPPGHYLRINGVAAVGETMLFNGERDPATGRTVLGFEESLSTVPDEIESIIEENDTLLTLPLNDPSMTMSGDRTVVVESTVDPETTFS